MAHPLPVWRAARGGIVSGKDPERCKYRETHTDRTGLYIMVMIAMWSSCHNGDKLAKVQTQLDEINHSVTVAEESAEASHPPDPQNPASR